MTLCILCFVTAAPTRRRAVRASNAHVSCKFELGRVWYCTVRYAPLGNVAVARHVVDTELNMGSATHTTETGPLTYPTKQYYDGVQVGLDDVGMLDGSGISKGSISRRFTRMIQEALAELRDKPVNGIELMVLNIEGIVVAVHTVACVLGIDTDGKKHVLGLWKGATKNATVCKGPLPDLVGRGLKVAGLLVATDGSKALRRGVAHVLGNDVPVQRGQVHKTEDQRPWVRRKLESA